MTPDAVTFSPSYFVTRDGRVFSMSGCRGVAIREMAQHSDLKGYSCVGLRFGGPQVRVRIHRLVAEAFLPPRPSSIHQVRHLDGDRTNPNADNLAWGTPRENMRDRDLHGRTVSGIRHHSSRLTEEGVRAMRKERDAGVSVGDLARKYGVTWHAAYKVCARISWKHIPQDVAHV